MSDEVRLHPHVAVEEEVDPDWEKLVRGQKIPDDEGLESLSTEEGLESAGGWSMPFDLRVMRPRAVDLRKLWGLTGQPEPPEIAATLGAKRPILIHHVVTPFAPDGAAPGRVWGLGYEFVADDGLDANTVSVMPDNQVLGVARVGQSVNLGLQLGGGIGIPQEDLAQYGMGPLLSLSGASVRASTDQSFQFSVGLSITLRKVVGAPVGSGGALWKLYRQDERLDQPHALLQTVLVPEDATSIRCTVKTWAKQAGFLGMTWGSRFWKYDDQKFEISLMG